MAGAATNFDNEFQIPTANIDGTSFGSQRGQLVYEDEKKPRHEPTQDQTPGMNTLGLERTQHYKIIIVGESGLGKTTATRCLLHDLTDTPTPIPEDTSDDKTLKITTSDKIELKSDARNPGLCAMLRIVDTPGYGDNLDTTLDFRNITEFIEKQYEELYDAADKGEDPQCHDSLVTCCLYFIAPHRIKDNDIAFMKEVSKKLPIVPIIAKADTMTVSETKAFREKVAQELTKAGIRTYDFNGQQNPRVSAKPYVPPFTLIADKNMKERVYEWGSAELANTDHSDFMLIKTLVIKEHLELMRKNAYQTYQEDYRLPRINQERGGWVPGPLKKKNQETSSWLRKQVLGEMEAVPWTDLIFVHFFGFFGATLPFLKPGNNMSFVSSVIVFLLMVYMLYLRYSIAAAKTKTAIFKGLKWNAVLVRPVSGTQITNEGLAATLPTKLDFTQEEVDGFELDKSFLSHESYITVGDNHFRPLPEKIPSMIAVIGLNLACFLLASFILGVFLGCSQVHSLNAPYKHMQGEFRSQVAAAESKGSLEAAKLQSDKEVASALANKTQGMLTDAKKSLAVLEKKQKTDTLDAVKLQTALTKEIAAQKIASALAHKTQEKLTDAKQTLAVLQMKQKTDTLEVAKLQSALTKETADKKQAEERSNTIQTKLTDAQRTLEDTQQTCKENGQQYEETAGSYSTCTDSLRELKAQIGKSKRELKEQVAQNFELLVAQQIKERELQAQVDKSKREMQEKVAQNKTSWAAQEITVGKLKAQVEKIKRELQANKDKNKGWLYSN
mmetsp:Transcript_41356/g.60875  ORF Transcript_41356/g.60875 Transcript_41356/m.60875 type:complete len:783 (+) Transcript_41356:629-2977(+)